MLNFELGGRKIRWQRGRGTKLVSESWFVDRGQGIADFVGLGRFGSCVLRVAWIVGMRKWLSYLWFLFGIYWPEAKKEAPLYRGELARLCRNWFIV